jgi:hypothetical protein
MRRNPLLLSAILLCNAAVCFAYTPDLVGHGRGERVHGLRSVFVRGYGEVIFETRFDPVLVIDPAYATAGTSGSWLPSRDGDDTLKIALHPVNPPHWLVDKTGDDRLHLRLNEPMAHDAGAAGRLTVHANAIPETAAAAVGLLGMLLLLRRNHALARRKPLHASGAGIPR